MRKGVSLSLFNQMKKLRNIIIIFKMSPFRLINLFLLFQLITTISCSSSSTSSSSSINHESDLINYELLKHSRMDPVNETIVLESWNMFSSKLNELITSKVDHLQNYYHHLMSETRLMKLNISTECDESIKFFFNQAKSSQSWAVKMLNSWPRIPPSGVFEGTFSDFGSYHQCKDIHEIIDGSKLIKSQYCSIKFKPLLSQRPRFHNIHEQIPILSKFYSQRNGSAISSFASTAQYFYYTNLRFGVCLPVIINDSLKSNSQLKCSLNDVHQLAQKVGLDFSIQGSLSSCEEFHDSSSFDLPQIISILIISICVSLTIFGTIFHHFWEAESKFSLRLRIISSFSIVKSTKSIFTKSGTQFTCLNGIRVLTLIWIILGHLMLWSHRESFSRSFNVLSIVDPLPAIGLFNATVSIDTFFLISGFLTCYVTMNVTSGVRENFSIFWYLASRYMRLTPGMIFAVCLMFLVPLLGEGPLWKETFNDLTSSCHDNWWLNLFYVQVYVNSERICLLPTWWLSVDMTLHVVSLFILLVLFRSKKLGLFLVFIFVVICCSLVGRTNYHFGFPPAFIWGMPQVDEQWTEMTLQWIWTPQYHASAYFTGFLLGYLLYFKSKSLIKLNLTRKQMTIGWIISFVAMIVILKINIIWHYGHVPWNQTFAAFWSSTSILIWSLGVSWIIFACSTSSQTKVSFSNLINTILSWSAFRPLARVSYMVYLTHMFLIWSYSGSRTSLVEMSSFTGLYVLISHIFCSYLIGFICTILVESPFLDLQKMFLQRHQKRKEERELNDENHEIMKVLTITSV